MHKKHSESFELISPEPSTGSSGCARRQKASVPSPLTRYRVQVGSLTHGDPVGTTIEYLETSESYWHEHLRASERSDLVAANLAQAITRYTQADDVGQRRISPVLRRLLNSAPETPDAVLEIAKEAAATLEAKEWLEDQWRRQEARADKLQAEMDRWKR